MTALIRLRRGAMSFFNEFLGLFHSVLMKVLQLASARRCVSSCFPIYFFQCIANIFTIVEATQRKLFFNILISNFRRARVKIERTSEKKPKL